MKHHEVILDFSRRGIATLAGRLFTRTPELRPAQSFKVRLGVREPS
jgi:hypothetical protein